MCLICITFAFLHICFLLQHLIFVMALQQFLNKTLAWDNHVGCATSGAAELCLTWINGYREKYDYTDRNTGRGMWPDRYISHTQFLNWSRISPSIGSCRHNRIIEYTGLEESFKGHLIQSPCSKKEHLQLDQNAPKPDLECFQRWDLLLVFYQPHNKELPV